VIPPPGSLDALARGCKCSPKRNRAGFGVDTGAAGRVYFFEVDCPLHGDGDWRERDQAAEGQEQAS
jgi:hypothetical protein